MAQKRSEGTTTTTRLVTHSAPNLQPPPWSALALIALESMIASHATALIELGLQVQRGRAGTYITLDFVLVLMTFALSFEPNLKTFYARLPPVADAFAALGNKTTLCSRAALGRFLQALQRSHVALLATMMLDDLIRLGVWDDSLGHFDRCGHRTLIFDADGTYHGARERAITEEASRPALKRRTEAAFKPGYRGRKRAEVIRNRMTLQFSHTQEWLGCWSAPGNGDLLGHLVATCEAMIRYLTAHAVPLAQGLLRLDGAYGTVGPVWTITNRGLGYVTRCADYRLLKRHAVQQVLLQAPEAIFTQLDTGTVRQVWQVPEVLWSSTRNPGTTVDHAADHHPSSIDPAAPGV